MDAARRRMLCSSLRRNGTAVLLDEFIGKNPRCRMSMSMNTKGSLQAAKPTEKPFKKSYRTAQEYRTPTRKSPPKSSSHTSSQTRTNPLRYRTIPIIFGSITLLAISGYCGYLFVAYTKYVPASSMQPVPTDMSYRYDDIARTFDKSVDGVEQTMGITRLRKKLIQEARGDVLEVSIGTGRNLEFYDWDFKGYNGVGKVRGGWRGKGVKRGKVKSFTAVDKSGAMLEVAREKFAAMFPGIGDGGVRWIVQDAGERIPGPQKNADQKIRSKDVAKYDTVVQTMGLCSVSDPVQLLRNLGECVKEVEGRILLLEHGRGWWEWLNEMLDNGAEAHAKEFGCWWNRDLGKIVEESGLEIVKVKRPYWWHGGTTWWIELRKIPNSSKETGII